MKAGRILIELDGVPTDIATLKKEDYEQVLKMFQKLIAIYKALKEGK